MHMVHGYMDECGDTGFNTGTRYFTVCAFITASSKACAQKLKEQKTMYQNLHHHPMNKEIKASKLTYPEKMFFLKGWKELDFVAYVGCLDTKNPGNKKNALGGLEKKMIASKQVIVNSLSAHPNINKLILDKGLLAEEQIDALKKELRTAKMPCPPMKSRNSEKVAGLAFADILGHIVRKHREGDSSLYRIIPTEKIKIIEI